MKDDDAVSLSPFLDLFSFFHSVHSLSLLFFISQLRFKKNNKKDNENHGVRAFLKVVVVVVVQKK